MRHTVVRAWPVLLLLLAGVARSFQAPQPDRAKIRDLLAKVTTARNANELDRAIALAEEAKTIAEKSLKADDPELARVRIVRADLERMRAILANNLPRGLEWANYARQVAERSLEPGDPDRVTAIFHTALLSRALNDHRVAREALELAASEAELKPHANRDALVKSLFVLAQLQHEQGDDSSGSAVSALSYATALMSADEPLLAQSQELAAALVWFPMVLRAHRAMDDGRLTLDEAEARLRDELEKFEARLVAAGVSPAVCRLGLIWLAQFQWERQRFAATAGCIDDLATTIDEAGIAPSMVARYWNLRGLVETEARANFVSARQCYERALAVSQKANAVQQTALTMNNLGQLMLRQGDYRTAQGQLQRAVDLFANVPDLQRDPSRPYALTNLAKSLEAQFIYDAAPHREALRLIEASNRPDAFAQCLCRVNLGINRYGAGSFDEAAGEFVRARELAVKAFGAEHQRVAEIDVNLGWLALEQGRLDEAQRRLQSALTNVEHELGEEHHRAAEIMAYLARVLKHQGTLDEARGLLERAAELRSAYLRRTVNSALSEPDRLAFVQELRVHPESIAWPGVLDTYLELADALKIPPSEQYRQLIGWKGVVRRHALPRADQIEDEPEIQRLAREREEVLGKRRSAYFTRPRPSERRRHAEMIGQLEQQAESLERSLRAESERFARGANSPDPTAGQIADALAPDEAFLDVIQIRSFHPRKAEEPVKVDTNYLGFLVRHDRPIVRIGPIPAADVDDAIDLFREAMEPGTEFAKSTGTLARLLREPLLPHLVGIKFLILAGDGRIHELPVAALPGRKPNTFWIEDIAFLTVPSAHSLIGRAERKAATGAGALIVGGLDYGPPQRESDWKRLDGTLAEAEAVKYAFRRFMPEAECTVITDRAGDEPTIIASLPRHRFVHLATHGSFRARGRSTNPFEAQGLLARLDSYLVLANANAPEPGGPDQLLTAEEINNLDLHAIELMVLSACETGLGHISSGQGVVGLLEALDRAGVASVISALWKVDDLATKELMVAFYRHYWSANGRVSPAYALRRAQLDLIHGAATPNGKAEYKHPQYWAAFIVSGRGTNAGE